MLLNISQGAMFSDMKRKWYVGSRVQTHTYMHTHTHTQVKMRGIESNS